MPPLPARKPHISPEDYLVGERQSEWRHEYINGQVYAMVGASRPHNLIVNALAVALTPAARRQRCQLFTSDMKLRLDFAGQQVFYYPDLLLSCDTHDRDDYFCRHPCLLVEVLSDSTERIDRREKLLAYQILPSLQAYWLVAQDAPRIEVYRRAQGWLPDHYTAGQTLTVDCLGLELAVDEVYQDLDWSAHA